MYFKKCIFGGGKDEKWYHENGEHKISSLIIYVKKDPPPPVNLVGSASHPPSLATSDTKFFDGFNHNFPKQR